MKKTINYFCRSETQETDETSVVWCFERGVYTAGRR